MKPALFYSLAAIAPILVTPFASANDGATNTVKTEISSFDHHDDLKLIPEHLWTSITPEEFKSLSNKQTSEYREEWPGTNGFVADNGHTDAWQVSVASGSNLGASHIASIPGKPKEVITRYRVLLPSNAYHLWKEADSHIKMPGPAANISMENGGFGGGYYTRLPVTMRAWSARQMLTKPRSHYPDFAMGMELYHVGSKNVNGRNRHSQPRIFGETKWYSPDSSTSAAMTLTPGQWAEVTVHIRMNTPRKNDGFIRTYLNGFPAYTNDAIRWSDATEMLSVDNFWFNVYHGGARKRSSGTLNLYFRDFQYLIVG